MTSEEEIEQLQARIDALRAKREPKNTQAQLGYYAKRTCESELATIKTMIEYLNFDDTPERVYSAFQQINKSSYTIMRAIERDIAEKE